MINWGSVPLNSVIPFFFDSFDGGTGASITLTGLAVTDIEIYKGTSMTQRSSDAGVVLLDTDGIDVDGVTGIHGFSIDTSDNTDAGFYVAGAFYTVVVASVTIDAQTVNFVAGTFYLTPATSIAGQQKVDVGGWLGTAPATPTVNGVPEVDVTHWLGTAAATPTVGGVPEVDVTHAGGAAAVVIAGQVDTRVVSTVADAIVAGSIGANAIGASELAADAVDEIVNAIYDELTSEGRTAGSYGQLLKDNLNATVSSRATQTSVDAIDDFVDTEVAAIKAVTDALPNAGALTTIQADLDNIQTRLPTDLVLGRMDSSVGAVAPGGLNGSIGTGSFLTGAIDAGALAADAATEIAAAVWAAATRTLTGLGITLAAADIATDAIGADEFAQAAADKVWASVTRTLTALGFVIQAADIGTDAIGAAELAADAATEIADAVASASGKGFTL